MGGRSSSSVTQSTTTNYNTSSSIGDIGLTGESAVQLARVLSESAQFQTTQAYETVNSLINKFQANKAGIQTAGSVDTKTILVIAGLATAAYLIQSKK
jgi:hypothetical protein